MEAAQFYNAVSRTGINYGPNFRMVRRTNIAPDTAAQLRCAPHILVVSKSNRNTSRQIAMGLAHERHDQFPCAAGLRWWALLNFWDTWAL